MEEGVLPALHRRCSQPLTDEACTVLHTIQQSGKESINAFDDAAAVKSATQVGTRLNLPTLKPSCTAPQPFAWH